MGKVTEATETEIKAKQKRGRRSTHKRETRNRKGYNHTPPFC